MNQVIPDAAVEAAARAMYAQDGGVGEFSLWVYQDYAKAMLEAAAPHMLSHEREETRLAHVDAMVNAQTVDRLQRVVDVVLDIANVRMDSDYGDPTFVAGWESALEEVNARIKDSIGGSDNE